MTDRAPGGMALAFIFITILINMIGFGVIMPVMPQLIMAVTGEDVASAARWGGLVSLSYALMQFIMMPILGGLSDRFGRRPIILISLGAYSLDFLVLAMAPTIAVIIAARAVAGMFAATFATANAYIADISPPEKRAANFGLIGAAFGLGFIIGPGLGGIIGDQFGPRAPFYFVAMLGMINLTFGYFVLPETLSAENRRPFEWARANAFGNLMQFRQYPIMLPVASTIFLYQLAHWAVPSVWAYYVGEKLGWGASQIGWSLMFVGLTVAIVQGGLTRVAVPRLGERNAAFIGVFVALTSYIGFAFVNSSAAVYALIAYSALGGLSQPALQGIMSRTISDDAQGELQGAIAAITSLAMIISPPVMTQIFAAFSKPNTPVVIAGIEIFKNGAPIYFPGAPFILAAGLTVLAVIPLVLALMRAKPVAAAQEAPAE